MFSPIEMLALEYLVLTERFDQANCRGRDPAGVAIPQTGIERRACTRNAYDIKSIIVSRGAYWPEVREATQCWLRRGYSVEKLDELWKEFGIERKEIKIDYEWKY